MILNKKSIIALIILCVVYLSYYIYKINIKNDLDKSLDIILKSKVSKNLQNVNKYSEQKYNYLLALQLKRWDLAKETLEKLADKKDPEATYWLAYTSGGNVFAGLSMFDLFRKSANLGDPYAALQLTEDGDYCTTYLKPYCDDSWYDKAKVIFEEKFNKGRASLLDRFYYEIIFKGDYLSKDIADIIVSNMEVGEFAPLIKYTRYIVNNFDLSDDEKNKLKNILKIPNSKNYYPSLSLSYYSNELDFNKKNIVDKAFLSGDYCTICYVYFNDFKNRDNVIKNGINMIVGDTLKDSDKIMKTYKLKDLTFNNGMDFIDYYFKSNQYKNISESEKINIFKKSLEKLNSHKIDVYINQFNYGL